MNRFDQFLVLATVTIAFVQSMSVIIQTNRKRERERERERKRWSVIFFNHRSESKGFDLDENKALLDAIVSVGGA